MSKTRITVNGKEYRRPEDMPPDVRQQYEQAMGMLGPALASAQGGATTRVESTTQSQGAQGDIVVRKTITVNNRALEFGQSKMKAFLDVTPSPSAPLPIEPSSAPSEGRRFVYDLAFWVIVGLALWYWLGRS